MLKRFVTRMKIESSVQSLFWEPIKGSRVKINGSRMRGYNLTFQPRTLFAVQKSWSQSQTLQQAKYRWLPLEYRTCYTIVEASSVREDFRKVHTWGEYVRNQTRSAGKKAMGLKPWWHFDVLKTIVVKVVCQFWLLCREREFNFSLSTKACPVVYWNEYRTSFTLSLIDVPKYISVINLTWEPIDGLVAVGVHEQYRDWLTQTYCRPFSCSCYYGYENTW